MMALRLTCMQMGFPCDGEATGTNMTELIAAVQRHVVEHHGYSEEQARSPEKIAEWKGAIASSARPPGLRTRRPDV